MRPALLFRPALLACLAAALIGCSQDDDGGSGADDPQIYRLAGTVAVGRPGEWAEVCIASDCTRANDEGSYRLSLPLQDSALLQAAIPEANGSTTRLTGFYRHDADVTTALANINPTTSALLDAWSRYRFDQPLNSCLATPGCEDSLVDSFSASVQATASDRLGTWLDDAWPYTRDPFSDVYIADPEADWLDNLHDHLRFSATATGLDIADYQGNALGSLLYANLFSAGRSAPLPLNSIDWSGLLDDTVPSPSQANDVRIALKVSPGSEFIAPETVTLDASNSESDGSSQLSYQHYLVAPDGSMRTYSEARLGTLISTPGPHNWVVTVTDGNGSSATEGIVLRAGSANPLANPQFGADGSCLTDPTELTPNSANICEQTLDGGELGQCTAIDSGSTITLRSPGLCSPVAQHGGELLGVCTDLINEIRIFHYNNPLRDTGETLATQRERLAQRCAELGLSWSDQPDN